MKPYLTSGFVLITLLLSACNGEGDTPAQNGKTSRDTTSLQDSFTTPIVQLTPTGRTETMLFGIKNCHVYKAVQTDGGINDWKLLFKPAPYALPKMCIIERMKMQGEYLHIEIGTQAIGAGGCCTTYAAYRTLNGERWDIRPATSIETWQPLDIND